MKKFIALSFLALIVSGCQSVAPPQTYQPAKYPGKTWNIAGELNKGAIGLHLIITINNEKVIDDDLSMMGKGEFQGKYLKSAVTASCDTAINPVMGHTTYCTVYVDGGRAADFTFK